VRGTERALIGLAVLLSPRSCRETRREQWLADWRDAEELGLSSLGVAAGACLASLRSRGSRPALSASAAEQTGGTNMTISKVRPRAVIRLAGGVLAASALLSGGVLAGTGWLGAQVQSVERRLSLFADGTTGPVTISNDTGKASWVDVSTLTVVGKIDPATGETVPVTPYHPAPVPRTK
jgi:hypothetical protein